MPKNFNKEDYIGYKLNIYPTKEQEQIFKEYFDACRAVYNLGIDIHEEYRRSLTEQSKYKTISFYSMGTELVRLKKTDKYKWLNKFDAYCIKQVLMDVKTAYEMFFKGNCRYPKYKKKKFAHQMFPVRSDRLSIHENYIKIPSIGQVKCICNDQKIIGNGYKEIVSQPYRHYCNARIIFDGYSYWLTFEMEINHEEGIEPNSCNRFKNNEIWNHKDYSEPIGIDLGCKKDNWIVDSKGNRITRPDCSKEERQIKKYKRKLAIKKKANDKGKITNSTVTNNEVKRIYTKNEEKILRKLNKAYKRITNKKEAVIHDYACSIIAEKPSSIVMEDLDVKNMLMSGPVSIESQRHNKLVKDSMLYTIRTIIEHKANANNIPFILADREYPSSQLCSKCGHRQKIGILRTYKCPVCGNEIDRDMNAALNLSYLGYPDFDQYNYIIA